MALAAEAADAGWRDVVERALAELVRRGAPFATDDVRGLGVVEPECPAPWGAVFRTAHLHLLDRTVVELQAVRDALAGGAR